MHKSRLFLTGICILCALMLATALDAHLRSGNAEEQLSIAAGRVQSLQLTDLSLFTEARYTRHPTQADWHSAFQEHPLALEHFPSGSLLPPPETIR